jgi:hypothetical protein
MVLVASHGLVVVDVGVSGSSHDVSVIARLITSKILTCFFLMLLDDPSSSASREFTVVSMKKRV